MLNSNTSFLMADLYTFTLAGGAGLYFYSGAQTALTVGGRVFAKGPKFDRSKTKVVIGIQVDQLDLFIYPETTDMLGSLTWMQAASGGVLDGALVTLERVFMPSYGDTSPGTVVLFTGRVGDLDISRTRIDMKIRSLLELLNIQMPRRLWQSPCTHLFGGSMCVFDRTSMLQPITAGANSTQTNITTSLVPNPTNLFDLGTATAVTGDNVGASRTISALKNGIINVKPKFLFPVVAGNIFNLLPGCDRSFSSCLNTFNNVVHFGGCDQIPVPETAI